MVAVPVSTPVTTPRPLTVATAGSEVVQVTASSTPQGIMVAVSRVLFLPMISKSVLSRVMTIWGSSSSSLLKLIR